jgi:hypothetical protein
VSTVTDFQFAIGDGVKTAFTIVDPSGNTAVSPSVASLYRADWQGKQLLYTTARTNFALQSNTFQTSWVLLAATIQADAVAGPDGVVDADKLKETNTTSIHRAGQTWTMQTGLNTVSVIAKAGERSELSMPLDSGVNSAEARFDLASGVVTSHSGASYVGSTITPLGNGWYLCSCTINVTTGAAGGSYFEMYKSGVRSYPGTTGEGLYLRDAQFEFGGTATSRIRTVGASASNTDYSVAGSVATLSPAPLAAALLSWTGTDSNGAFIPGHGSAAMGSGFGSMGVR